MSFDEKLKALDEKFPADEIEWRIDRVFGQNKDKAFVLAYINARAVRQRLDEVVGKSGWKVEFKFFENGIKKWKRGQEDNINGVIARISIFNPETEQWIYKEDGSDFTDIEPFKGGISGAIKRAAVAWGIGAYLYEFDNHVVDILSRKPNAPFELCVIDRQHKYFIKPELPAHFLPSKDKGYSKKDYRNIPDKIDNEEDSFYQEKEEKLLNISFQKDLSKKTALEVKNEIKRMCKIKDFEYLPKLKSLADAVKKAYPDLTGDDMARACYNAFIAEVL